MWELLAWRHSRGCVLICKFRVAFCQRGVARRSCGVSVTTHIIWYTTCYMETFYDCFNNNNYRRSEVTNETCSLYNVHFPLSCEKTKYAIAESTMYIFSHNHSSIFESHISIRVSTISLGQFAGDK